MNAKQLREYVIKPVLTKLNAWTPESEDLVLGTACQESFCGKYVRQIGCEGAVGAFGIWQMELATARDIYDNYLRYKPELRNAVDSFKSPNQSITDALMLNIGYACAMCRVHYLRQPGAIPKDLLGQAQYYKKYYNTPLGKATVEQYIENWEKYARG